MVVALAATHGRTEPRGGDCSHPVGGVFRQIFPGLRAAFTSDHVQAIEAGGDELFAGWFGQEIAGELLNRELIERLVLVERIDHVVAIRKNVHVLIAVIADSVGEPHDIQPRDRHPFAEMR